MNTLPSTDAAKLICLLFRRSWGTARGSKEIKAFKQLAKDRCFEPLDDLMLVIAYHNAERKKGEKGRHRRDLFTFLNNYHGELDRARDWGEKTPMAGGGRPHMKPPELWAVFLKHEYPKATPIEWRQAPDSIKAEFRRWEEQNQ